MSDMNGEYIQYYTGNDGMTTFGNQIALASFLVKLKKVFTNFLKW